MRRHRATVGLLSAILVVAACSSTPAATDTATATPTATSADPTVAGSPSSSAATESMDHSSMGSMDMSTGPLSSSVAVLPATSVPAAPAPATAAPAGIDVLPGMPPVTDPHNVYSEAGVNMLGPAAKQSKAYAYVPNTKSGDVWVIDAATFQIVDKFSVGVEVQHVVPSYDMTELFATDDQGDVVRRIDPFTGQAGETIPVKDPYNMYFTPDGKYAISVAEKYRELVWYDPKTWRKARHDRRFRLQGIDHADFTADGKTAVFTCEFAGRAVVVDIASHQIVKEIDMPTMNTTMGPQDIKLAPDGSVYYIADSDSNGVWVMDATSYQVLRHIATGGGAHGLYLSRDATAALRHEPPRGQCLVLNAYTGDIITKWQIPGGGSPDMGNVSADGSQLWLSGRYDNVVYVSEHGRRLA